MREIRFRAWDFENKQMRTELRASEIGMLVEGGYKGLMQFTGLLDKNGKEVFEGDIVRNENDQKPNQQIIFAKGMFCLDDEDSPLWKYAPQSFWEIIGNIYQNPELLTN